jgi:hypothetical protein
MNKDTRVVDAENVKIPQSSVSAAKQELSTDIMPAAPQTAAPVLDPAILAAIQAAVVGSVKEIVAALKPVTGAAPQAMVPTQDTRYPMPYVPPYEEYKSKLKGIPVEAGQDLRHVHPMRINEWFRNIELRAAERLKAAGLKNGLQTTMTIGRG